jgi:hypothetical protein
VQPLGGQRQVAVGEGSFAVVGEPLEDEHVQLVGGQLEPVPARRGQQRRLAGRSVQRQGGAQGRDVGPQHPTGGRGRLDRPQRVDQAVGQHQPVRVQEQHGQQDPLLRCAEPDRVPVRAGCLQRTQDQEPHPPSHELPALPI